MKYTGFLALLPLLLFGCKGNQSTETTENETELKSAVCIYDGVPVRAEPGKDGKWLTSLNLGESLIYLDKEYKDTEGKGQDFYKVELSDGSQVWARSYGIALNAKAGAILNETPIYKRPDLVNKTDKVFNPLEFVAVVGQKDDWWIEVIGANKKKSGWIKIQFVSSDPEDVAVATLAHKSLLDKEGKIITENLQSFIDGLPYQNTHFNGYLNSLLDKKVSEEVEESIINYEGESGGNAEGASAQPDETEGE
jgi:hypothetical protein